MKQAIVLILAIAAAFGCGLWWSQTHPTTTAADASATNAPPAEEGTKVTHDEQGNTIIDMSDDQQGDAGIVFGNPAAGQWKPEVKGYGRVLDPSPLAGLVNDLVTAQAAAAATQQEWDRQKTLSGQTNTSQRALQTAEAAARRDQLAVQAVRDKLALGWGDALAGRADLAEFVQLLTTRKAALARVDLPAGETLEPTPAAARLVALSGKTAEAKFLCPVPDVDPQIQGQGFIFLIQPNDIALAPGGAVTAWMQRPGDPLAGAIIPRDAVVRVEGEGWVYLMIKDKGGEGFMRRKILLDRPTENGWFVADSVKPDDYIVVTGAQTLLSEELKAALSPD